MMELDPLTVSDEELMRMVEQWELDAEMDTTCWPVSIASQSHTPTTERDAAVRPDLVAEFLDVLATGDREGNGSISFPDRRTASDTALPCQRTGVLCSSADESADGCRLRRRRRSNGRRFIWSPAETIPRSRETQATEP